MLFSRNPTQYLDGQITEQLWAGMTLKLNLSTDEDKTKYLLSSLLLTLRKHICFADLGTSKNINNSQRTGHNRSHNQRGLLGQSKQRERQPANKQQLKLKPPAMPGNGRGRGEIIVT
ncbi:unnamed protein product [Ceratitis capitata]|uniref:(Mediterranean fruit fly) hypothetical protein n=1 Tax=Ceratitis capitata TaxID=7213 RepID=A0A811UZ36_CERCA|nr:unnamed protein product [Ceratitis capitata]